MLFHPPEHSASRGVTLLEMTTVILVIAILATLLLPAYAQVQMRMQKANCIANLRSLHTGANLYVQEHHFWPQIKTAGVAPNVVAVHWVEALRPYGLSEINWLCPTVQKLLSSPDMTDPENARIDYVSTPFDTKPQTPYQWPKQPWFVETADVHGNGNLILFPDGHVQELGDFKAALQKSTGTSSAH